MNDTVTSVKAHGTDELAVAAIWVPIPSAACLTWRRGELLQPVAHGDQVLRQRPV